MLVPLGDVRLTPPIHHALESGAARERLERLRANVDASEVAAAEPLRALLEGRTLGSAALAAVTRPACLAAAAPRRASSPGASRADAQRVFAPPPAIRAGTSVACTDVRLPRSLWTPIHE